MCNFSTSQDWTFILSPESKAGYILNGDRYVDLDKGLSNFLFKYEFGKIGFDDQVIGYRINDKQNLILDNGNIIMKETLLEVATIQELTKGSFEINESNITLSRVRFQVEGNSILHVYALEAEILELILTFLEKNKPQYLTTILLKNNKGKTPLDISIENHNTFSTELFVGKLTLFKNTSLSILFFDKFSELLAMSIQQFNSYLESCTFQTAQMKQIKNLNLIQEKGPWMLSHSSCLIDNQFTQKYCQERGKDTVELGESQGNSSENSSQEEVHRSYSQSDSIMDKESNQDLLEAEKEHIKDSRPIQSLDGSNLPSKERRLQVQAMEFDWIFNKKEGVGFLRTLILADCIDLFSILLVQKIVKFYWSYMRKYIIGFLLVPYVFYFILFIAYATYFHKKKIDGSEIDKKNFATISVIAIAFLIIFIIYYSFFEIRQMWFQKLKYFWSFWNLLNMSSLVINLLIVILDLLGARLDLIVSLLAWAVLLMWVKLFYFGRIFISTATMIRLVLEISWGMKFYIIMFIVVIAGFGNSFMILARNHNGKDIFTGDNYWRSFLYSYSQSLGNFDTDNYIDQDEYYLFAIWVTNTLSTSIIFTTLLIANMGDTFGRVQEISESNKACELATFMVENEILISKSQIFGDAKYVIMIEDKDSDNYEEDWEGRLQNVNKYMVKRTQIQNNHINAFIGRFKQKFEEKADDLSKKLENDSSRYIDIVMDKADQIESMLKAMKAQKIKDKK